MCILRKSLYRLKQSSKACLNDLPLLIGLLVFSRSHKDQSVFWRHQGRMLLIVVYVDDIIIGDDVRGLQI